MNTPTLLAAVRTLRQFYPPASRAWWYLNGIVEALQIDLHPQTIEQLKAKANALGDR